MKIFLVSLLMCAALLGEEREESSYEGSVRRSMEGLGIKVDGLSFQQEGTSSIVKIKRKEKLIGYYSIEAVWEPAKVEVPEGVTKIEFGYGKEGPALITITDKEAISLWLSAYSKYTEKAKYYFNVTTLTEDAGFPEKREGYGMIGGCMCSLGLYLYKGDEVVAHIEGHLDKCPEIRGVGFKNEVLHALVVENMPIMKPEPRPVDPNVYDDSPFTDHEEEIKKWVLRWVETFNEDDPEKMMAFYQDGEDAKDLDMLVSIGRWHHGREEALKAYEGDAKVLDYYDSKCVDLKARWLGGNYALVSFQHHFKMKVKGQNTRLQARIRTTMTLKWIGGGWKIVQEHSSPMENVPRLVEIGE